MSRSVTKRNLKALEHLKEALGNSKDKLPPIKITEDQVIALKNGKTIKIYDHFSLNVEDLISLDNLDKVTNWENLLELLTTEKLRKLINGEL